jgi:hypothetical protein
MLPRFQKTTQKTTQNLKMGFWSFWRCPLIEKGIETPLILSRAFFDLYERSMPLTKNGAKKAPDLENTSKKEKGLTNMTFIGGYACLCIH